MKVTAGSGKRSGYTWGGEPIVKYINSLPYTAQMLERREKRLADVAQSDKTIYTTDTKLTLWFGK